MTKFPALRTLPNTRNPGNSNNPQTVFLITKPFKSEENPTNPGNRTQSSRNYESHTEETTDF